MQIFYSGNKNVLLTFILTPIFSFQIIQHSKWFEPGGTVDRVV